MRFRWYLANVLVIALVLALMTHFLCILIYGQITIQEPVPAILFNEIGLLILILIFAIYNLIKGEGG